MVNLVQQKQGRLPGGASPLAGALGYFANLAHPDRDRAVALHEGVGVVRNQVGEAGFAAARRRPQNHRAERALLDRLTQGHAGREQVGLPHELLERAGAHARG